MNDALLSALGLCRKAGKLKIGSDAAVEALLGGAPLGVYSSDASDRTVRGIENARRSGADIVCLNRTMNEIEQAIGRKFAVAAVCDKGLAELVKKNLSVIQGG